MLLRSCAVWSLHVRRTPNSSAGLAWRHSIMLSGAGSPGNAAVPSCLHACAALHARCSKCCGIGRVGHWATLLSLTKPAVMDHCPSCHPTQLLFLLTVSVDRNSHLGELHALVVSSLVTGFWRLEPARSPQGLAVAEPLMLHRWQQYRPAEAAAVQLTDKELPEHRIPPEQVELQGGASAAALRCAPALCPAA